MNLDDIAHSRLANLQLSQTSLRTPAEIVAYLGAMQAQDYAGAKWSLGVRLWPTSDVAIEGAFNQGEILRTHVLRPTWHFVAPQDIRWLLALTAPRVHQVNAGMYRQVGMDGPALRQAIDALIKILEGGKQRTRDELRDVLQKEGIAVEGVQRMTYIMMNAELDGIVCSGPRRGKQFTYMLLDERAPPAKAMARDEALAALARRYFTGHGPATVHDLSRWSSLTLTDVREGIKAAEASLQHEEVDGQTYWFADQPVPGRRPSPTAYLLSIYDEYTVGYKDHSAIGEREHGEALRAMGNALQNVIILDGKIAGTWRRTFNKDTLGIELNPLKPFTDSENAAIAGAARQCAAFFGLVAVVE